MNQIETSTEDDSLKDRFTLNVKLVRKSGNKRFNMLFLQFGNNIGVDGSAHNPVDDTGSRSSDKVGHIECFEHFNDLERD